MYFNSIPFLTFMAVVVATYYALQVGKHHRVQNVVLLAASYVFYAWFDWRLCGLLAASTCVNYVIGARIHKSDVDRTRTRWLMASLAFNLGLLGFFKYFNFFVANVDALLGSLGLEMTWTIENLIIPVGISFYTFQTLSYTIDIHRRRFEPVSNFLDFALFVVFFPQLIMGPIERATNLLPQIQKPRETDTRQFLSGGWLIFLGLYKKIFIADQLTKFCDPIFAVQNTYAGWDVALGALLFTLQIYADFSGYSDIARGSARLMGFELTTNFRAPYFARNVQDYWNRWHISLTTWIRDYIYYPLAVHRRWGKLLGAGGLAIVSMLIMGFWHGSDWMFVAWGAYHGVLLAIYAKLRPVLHRRTSFESTIGKHAWHAVCILFTLSLIVFSELLFRPGYNKDALVSPIEQSGRMIRDLFTNPIATETTLSSLFIALRIYAVLFVLDALEFATGRDDALLSWPTSARRIIQAFMLYSMVNALADHDTRFGEPFRYLF